VKVLYKMSFAIELYLKNKDDMEWIMNYFDENGELIRDRKVSTESKSIDDILSGRKKVEFSRDAMIR
jgi:hypothetical protein